MPKLLRRTLIVAITASIWFGLVAISYKGFTTSFKIFNYRTEAQKNLDWSQRIDGFWIDALLFTALNVSLVLTPFFLGLGPVLAWRFIEHSLFDWDEDDPHNPNNWDFWGD